MATGTINNPWAEETITVTLNPQYVQLASWGSVTGARKGNIVFIRINGLQVVNAITTQTIIGTFSGTPASSSVVTPVFTSSSVGGLCIASLGTNNISVNSITSVGTNYYAELIFPVG